MKYYIIIALILFGCSEPAKESETGKEQPKNEQKEPEAAKKTPQDEQKVAKFDQYRKDFAKLAKLDITQVFLETNPQKKSKVLTTNEALEWVVKPIITKTESKTLLFTNQGISGCIRSDKPDENKTWLDENKVTYYKYGQVELSENYRSLIYFFVDQKMWKEGIKELYCFVANYSAEGELIDGIMLGRYSKFTNYQVDVSQQLPEQTLWVRNLGYSLMDDSKKKEYENDHYYQITNEGKVMDVQLKYYPYNGKFVDAEGNKMTVEQDKKSFNFTYWQANSGSGQGAGNLTKEQVGNLGNTNEKESFTVEVKEKKYDAVFASKDELKIAKSDGKIWAFKRKKK